MSGRDPYPDSGAWLAARTDDQLREQIAGNFPGARAHDGARAELDRREAARTAAAEMRWIKRTFWATVILGLAAIAVTIAAAAM